MRIGLLIFVLAAAFSALLSTSSATAATISVILTASPVPVLCDGKHASTVTVYAFLPSGAPVPNGTEVQFRPQNGVARPARASTASGQASTPVFPASGVVSDTVSVTVSVRGVGTGANSIRVDCEPSVRSRTYMASGDSIPAGTDLNGGKTNAYPAYVCDHLTGPHLCTKPVAHSGDTTDRFIHDQLPIILFVNPDLVTITIGADDIFEHLERFVTDCGVADSRTNLAFILTSILSRTTAQVVITGYYNPLSKFNGWWLNAEACTAEGNNVIHETVVDLTRTWPNRIVEVPLHDLFAGHEYGTSGSWISPCTSNLWCRVALWGIHPNASGQQAIGQAIIAALH